MWKTEMQKQKNKMEIRKISSSNKWPCPKEFSMMMEIIYMLSNVVASRHEWLLSTWNVASITKEVNS